MTLSETEAIKIIGKINTLLREDYLEKIVDEPVDAATEMFLFVDIPEYSYDQFCKILEEFVRELNRRLGFARNNLPEAGNEAMSLLDRLYNGTFYYGFHGALLDASKNDYDGIKLVIDRFGKCVKSYFRENYSRWVAFKYLDSMTWNDRCVIAAVLLKRFSSFLPARIRNWPPERVAGKLLPIIQLCQDNK